MHILSEFLLSEKYEIFMNIASIDIGTNTVLMLIAEVKGKDINPLLNEYRIPRIGKGLQPGKPIAANRIKGLYDVLTEYSSIIHKYQCSKVLVKATNAFRIASNSSEIISEVKEKFGMSIEVISGTEEAALSYFGAISASDSENNIVIDIGGGSTEIIYGTRDKILYSKSFQAGVVSYTERFLKNDPPLPLELNRMTEQMNTTFAELSNLFPSNTSIIGVAGTPTTLSCIQLKLPVYDEDKIERSVLTLKDLREFTVLLGGMSSDEILSRYNDVVKGREDLLLTGTYILLHLIELLGSDKMIISSRGIRFGAVLKEIYSSDSGQPTA